MNPRKRLTVCASIFVCLTVCVISCKRPLSSKLAEQSAAPVSTSVSPAPCSIPFSGTLVNDTAKVLSDDSKNKLEQKLNALKSAGKIDFAVVTLNTTGEQPIADYSLALARCWSIGDQNPDGSGMLMLLAVDDRKWHMQISRSMEKVLSNEEIQDAGSQMTTLLRDRNYSDGIDKFVDVTINTIAPRRKVSIGKP